MRLRSLENLAIFREPLSVLKHSMGLWSPDPHSY